MNQNATDPTHRYALSAQAHARAGAVMPGGVNSPVRAYQAVGREPVTIASGAGAWMTDIDGNRYIDYVGSYGPLILGHARASVVEAVQQAAARGTTFGMPTEAESELAELVVEAVPGVEVVRFVNSGTEAVMSAIRLARAATGREKLVKCTGCYHGHSDGLLVAAGSGATTLGTPSSPGVTNAAAGQTVLVPYNNLSAMEQALSEHAGQVACVVVEPIAGNMGCILPGASYLAGLRALCDKYGALLVFDEVMTGFRVAYGGAQALYGVRPDLTCLGKIVGGGLPCAAYGGAEGLMRQVAPDGPVYQAGTLSGNPLAMAAGIATLKALQQPGLYDKLEAATAAILHGIAQAAQRAGVALVTHQAGSMATCFFTDQPVADYDAATACDTRAFAIFFGAMLDRGVCLPPSQFETWFVSTEHDAACVEQTVAAAAEALAAVAASR